MAAFCGLGSGCGPSAPARVVPSYDLFTARMVQMSADLNADGRLDQWSYLDGNRPIRGEADTDGDGRVDRWEYFRPGAVLAYVGTSSRNDGVEDTWTFAGPADSERQIARSRQRDRQIDRREFYRGDVLVRVEEDTNADGRTDRWDRYDGGVLREVSLDTSFGGGRPDRRLLYDERGHFVAIEADPERDGSFVRLADQPPARQP